MHIASALKRLAREHLPKSLYIKLLVIKRRYLGHGPIITNRLVRDPSLESFLQRLFRPDPTWLAKPFALFNIELTNRCPFRCVMCARTHAMTRPQGDMGFDVFRKIIDEQVTANPKYTGEVWLHHFGESTQHPQFSEMMAYASSKGVNAGLSVNPVMLTPSVGRALLEAKPRVLTISLDGHDDASFEKIRGLPNIYEKSKQRLLEFLALKREMGSSTHIRLSMINFSLNGDSIGKLADEWRSTPGIDEFCAKPFAVWDGSVAAVNAFSNRKFEKRKKVTCEFPFTKMSIAWNGNVVPCCNDYNEKYVLGNVTEQPLSEIWNGEPMRRLRREFLDNKVSNNLCRKCPFLYHTPGEADSTFI